MVNIWITEEVETTFVSWYRFSKVDLKPHVHFILNPMSFFVIDMEKEVVLCCHGSRDVRDDRFCMLRMSPSGISRWYLPTRPCHVPTLFGYVPEELA
ncbi:hypothetical protein Bca4012_066693 [Brassica carinata]|uniref:F-box associated beta-propeller type 1 domain-containing protein n=1 Tax=Brassica carinata TaxID=52824 RepID=A0A8X8AZ68_BRACI|nr:hypothetical protein Bca52824_018970 [Brassica carinata]